MEIPLKITGIENYVEKKTKDFVFVDRFSTPMSIQNTEPKCKNIKKTPKMATVRIWTNQLRPPVQWPIVLAMKIWTNQSHRLVRWAIALAMEVCPIYREYCHCHQHRKRPTSMWRIALLLRKFSLQSIIECYQKMPKIWSLDVTAVRKF